MSETMRVLHRRESSHRRCRQDSQRTSVAGRMHSQRRARQSDTNYLQRRVYKEAGSPESEEVTRASSCSCISAVEGDARGGTSGAEPSRHFVPPGARKHTCMCVGGVSALAPASNTPVDRSSSNFACAPMRTPLRPAGPTPGSQQHECRVGRSRVKARQTWLRSASEEAHAWEGE